MYFGGDLNLKKRYQNLDNVNSRHFNPFKLIHYFYNRNKNKDLKSRIAIHDKRKQVLPFCSKEISYTWIGHSTFLIHIQDVTILTDPLFSRRMGVEKRLVPLGIEVNDLPEIDLVLISHAHYDHLDFPSLRKIKGQPHFFVPAGVKHLLTRRGYQNVVEVNWWEHLSFKTIDLDFVPSQHWSRRGPFDKNKAHWGGWIIANSTKTLYFVGDTAYFRGFKEIGQKYNIDTVLMPIGDYEPDWLSGLAHINPEKAVQAFLDLQASCFVPMHYGTYRLSMDTGPEALQRLQKEWRKQRLPQEKLNILKIGETSSTNRQEENSGD